MSETRFGPAGFPINYKGPSIEAPFYLHNEGLNALEYQATRGVKISKKDAEKLGLNAKECNIWLTLHAPYFINFGGERKVIAASKQRLIKSIKAAKWMGAHQVVFHPGYYGKKNSEESFKKCIKALNEVVEKINALGIKDIYLGPETTGKKSQIGTLEEILEICEKIEKTRPTIDFAHIHARSNGGIKSKDDYIKIVDLVERRLGSRIVKELHCHFTHVEFTDKGEKKHHTLSEKDYGPNFQWLAEVIIEQGLSPVIISESPILDLDSIEMKKIYLSIIESKK
ncbi:MAG: TIM barrel protein [Nitrososphaerota archaeon]